MCWLRKLWRWILGHGWIVVGLFGTAAYVGGLLWLRGSPSVIAAAARTLDLNALGDFLAGVFAPLAFLWLVVGILQQQRQISQNTRALEIQEKALTQELREMGELIRQGRAEADRAKKVAKPNIVLETGGGHQSEGRIDDFHVSLSNIGAPAWDVSIESESDDSPPRHRDVLNSGDVTGWIVAPRSNQPEFDVHVTYRDRLDTRYRQSFRVYAQEPRIEKLPVEEL